VPPPSTVGCSCVYIVRRGDGRFYCGQTDELKGRLNRHRSKAGKVRGGGRMEAAYLVVPSSEHGQSTAKVVEAQAIQVPNRPPPPPPLRPPSQTWVGLQNVSAVGVACIQKRHSEVLLLVWVVAGSKMYMQPASRYHQEAERLSEAHANPHEMHCTSVQPTSKCILKPCSGLPP